MQITFDNTSLTTTPFLIKSVDHDSAGPRDINLFNLARQRGAVLVNSEYRPKVVRLTGTITGATQAVLEANIDTLKELFSRQGKNLDIDYSGSTRRYIATNTALQISRDYFHLSYAPFSAEFIVPNGTGIDPTLSSTILTAITAASNVNTITMLGTAYPKPKITLTLTAVNTVSKIEFLANGDKITITKTFALNDVVVIDTDNMIVTVNGAVVDYTGIFPQFGIGANVYDIEITRTSCTYNTQIDYYKNYI